MGPQICCLCLARVKDTPRFYYQGSLLGEKRKIRSWRYLDLGKWCYEIKGSQMKGKKFEEINRVLMESFRLQVYVLKKARNSFLKGAIHLKTQFSLNDSRNLIVLFQSKRELANFSNPIAISTSLKVSYGFQNVISLQIEIKRSF